jgi:hypothetical protein
MVSGSDGEQEMTSPRGLFGPGLCGFCESKKTTCAARSTVAQQLVAGERGIALFSFSLSCAACMLLVRAT